MQEPRKFLGAIFESVKTSMRTPIVLDIYGDAVDMIAARDAEWQARVDTLLEDNARSEEQVKKQFATAVSFKARAEKAEARVDKLEAALRYLYDSGPTPEGFSNLDKDCYEYAIDMLNPGEDGLPDKDPRWFDGWLRMIEESAARAALGR